MAGRPVGRKKYPDAVREQARKDYLAGTSAAAIARDIGASDRTVRKWIKKEGWDRELADRRTSIPHLEEEIARLAAKKRKTEADIRKIAMLTRSLKRLSTLAPKPKPRPVVANAAHAELLQKALDPDYGLMAYQAAFLRDNARYRCVLKARQIGFSYVIGMSVVLGMAAGRDQIVVSASEDQAALVMEHVRLHAEKLGVAIEDDSAREIRIMGASCVALSTNWRTAQGYTGDVWFDEFAWVMRDKRLWGAVTPAITRVGGRITVCSTPFVPGNRFWEIATNHKNAWSHFSTTKITIHDAIKQGMPLPGGIDELKLNFDGATWAMFYECQWAEDGSALLPWSLIEEIADPADPLAMLPDDKTRRAVAGYGALSLGVDVGRINDRTAICLVGREADPVTGHYTGRVRLLKWKEVKGAEFAAQKEEIADWVRQYPIVRLAIDKTGLGMQLAEEVAGMFPEIAAGKTFTAPYKEKIALGLLRLAEQKQLVIPRDPDLMASLHAVTRTPASTGIRYDAPRDASGHADAFWALAMACEDFSPGSRDAAVEVW